MGPGNERRCGNELGARRAEQFPHLRNYTLTPGHHDLPQWATPTRDDFIHALKCYSDFGAPLCAFLVGKRMLRQPTEYQHS